MKYEIGSRIRKYREELGISQVQLAQKIGVSNSRVSNWEQGTNRPDADMIAKLCLALQVSPSELLNIHLSTEDYTCQERALIEAYRKKPELQHAVNLLLGIEHKP